jgi:hypothetical protein
MLQLLILEYEYHQVCRIVELYFIADCTPQPDNEHHCAWSMIVQKAFKLLTNLKPKMDMLALQLQEGDAEVHTYKEGHLNRKTQAIGSGWQKCFYVLKEGQLYCYKGKKVFVRVVRVVRVVCNRVLLIDYYDRIHKSINASMLCFAQLVSITRRRICSKSLHPTRRNQSFFKPRIKPIETRGSRPSTLRFPRVSTLVRRLGSIKPRVRVYVLCRPFTLVHKTCLLTLDWFLSLSLSLSLSLLY